jgi:hypothetical protein
MNPQPNLIDDLPGEVMEWISTSSVEVDLTEPEFDNLVEAVRSESNLREAVETELKRIRVIRKSA